MSSVWATYCFYICTTSCNVNFMTGNFQWNSNIDRIFLPRKLSERGLKSIKIAYECRIIYICQHLLKGWYIYNIHENYPIFKNPDPTVHLSPKFFSPVDSNEFPLPKWYYTCERTKWKQKQNQTTSYWNWPRVLLFNLGYKQCNGFIEGWLHSLTSESKRRFRVNNI